VLKDQTLLPRLQAAATPEEAKAIIKDAPGLKINLDRAITIEFTPRNNLDGGLGRRPSPPP
jgi:hypothetical protein